MSFELDYVLASNPVAIIGHQIGVNPDKLAAAIAKLSAVDRKKYIVTNNLSIGDEYSTMGYTAFVLSLTNSMVIFDSIDTLVSTLTSRAIPTLTSKGNYVLIMANIFSDEHALEQVRMVAPNALFLDATLTSKNGSSDDISFTTHLTKMTDYQHLVRHLSDDAKHENVAYPIAGNHPTLEHSPKITNLFNTINGVGGRHIVYTVYQRHGIDALKLGAGQSGISLHTDVEKFNRSKGTALLAITPSTSNQLTTTPPKDVRHLHLLDKNFHNVEKLVPAIYKYERYSQLPATLTVHYHLGNPEDTSEYERENQRLTNKIQRWSQAKPDKLIISS